MRADRREPLSSRLNGQKRAQWPPLTVCFFHFVSTKTNRQGKQFDFWLFYFPLLIAATNKKKKKKKESWDVVVHVRKTKMSMRVPLVPKRRKWNPPHLPVLGAANRYPFHEPCPLQPFKWKICSKYVFFFFSKMSVIVCIFFSHFVSQKHYQGFGKGTCLGGCDYRTRCGILGMAFRFG